MKYNTETPYIASYIVFRKKDKIAFVLRQNTNWMNGYYGLISGKVEKNESFLNAARREAKEEAVVNVKPQDLRQIMVAHRNDEGMVWVDMFFEATKWKGELYNAEPNIHSELVWLDPKSLPENVIPSVSFYIKQIQAGNSYAEYGWES